MISVWKNETRTTVNLPQYTDHAYSNGTSDVRTTMPLLHLQKLLPNSPTTTAWVKVTPPTLPLLEYRLTSLVFHILISKIGLLISYIALPLLSSYVEW